MVRLPADNGPDTVAVTSALDVKARWNAMTSRDTSDTGPFVASPAPAHPAVE